MNLWISNLSKRNEQGEGGDWMWKAGKLWYCEIQLCGSGNGINIKNWNIKLMCYSSAISAFIEFESQFIQLHWWKNVSKMVKALWLKAFACMAYNKITTWTRGWKGVPCLWRNIFAIICFLAWKCTPQICFNSFHQSHNIVIWCIPLIKNQISSFNVVSFLLYA